jgi:hypothetical protein
LDDAVMTRTISITLGVAFGYMLLVVGLMMWCRYRQLRRKQAYLEESNCSFLILSVFWTLIFILFTIVLKETGDAEMKDGNGATMAVVNGTGSLLLPSSHLPKAESCR